MNRKLTEQELKGGKLPVRLKKIIDRYPERIATNSRGDLCVDKDSGFATASGMAWDILLAAGWRHSDAHRVIIEGNANDAASLIANAERCDCDDCVRELA